MTPIFAQLVDEDGRRAGVSAPVIFVAPGSSSGPAGRRGCHPSRPDLRAWHRGCDRVDHGMSMALERTSMSEISSACSPVSGWLTSKGSMSTPSLAAYSGPRRARRR